MIIMIIIIIITTTRSEGRLFNVSHLKAKTKVRQLCVQDLLYAYETGFVSHSEVDLQTILDRFTTASASFAFSINVGKTEVLHQSAPGTPYTAPMILLNGMPLNVATTFKYLASTIANYCSFDKELEQTQHQACNKMQGLPCYHQFRDIHTV